MNDIFISGQEDAYFNSITCVDMSCNNISLTGALDQTMTYYQMVMVWMRLYWYVVHRLFWDRCITTTT